MWLRGGVSLAVLAATACSRQLDVQPAPPERGTRGDCPSGYAADDARASRIAHLAGATNEPAPPPVVVCFGPRGTPAAVTGSVVMLDGTARDVDLAPRLAHLLVHVEDGLGDGCARGRDAALASEERARRAEARARTKLNVTSAPVGLERDPSADYATRCVR